MCLLANAVCYVDRTNISVAIVVMRAEFGWSAAVEGQALAAFFYGYACTPIFGGWAATRWGGKPVMLAGVAFWSLFTALTPLAAHRGPTTLVVCRVLTGLGEGVTMPCTHSLLAGWLL